ncbi:hypothetical protein JOB18_035735 [Solea senegalensis]|uniref:NADH dehydrogenase [ubiquinone] iron-sulfur protein 5 n=2 Tax=Solea senegalensis TaxID=28829 RepID=A0AAV6R709_SOLSE|nr:hypothetical protein JOB18_035735 [Solea senegalensis]
MSHFLCFPTCGKTREEERQPVTISVCSFAAVKYIVRSRRKVKASATKRSAIMPFIDVQSWLGINMDRWMLLQSSEQPYKRAGRCHAFEKEWIECSHGIGQTRAKKECQLEFEDFYECMWRQKTNKRLYTIKKQRDALVKEGKYTPPPSHSGKEEQVP